jgi:site-specific DNA recombinase
MIKAIGYVRVSTDRQAEEGISLEMQIHKIEQYCELYNYQLIDIISDAGFSAKSTNRPGLKNLLQIINSEQADALIVYKLDRLTRSLADWSDLISKYFNEKSNKTLLSVCDQIDTSTASGRLCLNMMMTVYQWERETIAERTKSALAHKRKKGEPLGTARFGSNLTSKALEPNSDELIVIKLISDLRTEGKTQQQIADHLNQNNIRSKRDGIWYQRTVKNVLDVNYSC